MMNGVELGNDFPERVGADNTESPRDWRVRSTNHQEYNHDQQIKQVNRQCLQMAKFVDKT